MFPRLSKLFLLLITSLTVMTPAAQALAPAQVFEAQDLIRFNFVRRLEERGLKEDTLALIELMDPASETNLHVYMLQFIRSDLLPDAIREVAAESFYFSKIDTPLIFSMILDVFEDQSISYEIRRSMIYGLTTYLARGSYLNDSVISPILLERYAVVGERLVTATNPEVIRSYIHALEHDEVSQNLAFPMITPFLLHDDFTVRMAAAQAMYRRSYVNPQNAVRLLKEQIGFQSSAVIRLQLLRHFENLKSYVPLDFLSQLAVSDPDAMVRAEAHRLQLESRGYDESASGLRRVFNLKARLQTLRGERSCEARLLESVP